MKKNIVKNRRKKEGYAACYTYDGGTWVQYIYIKYADDVAAIDLLLEKNFERQAKFIFEPSCNHKVSEQKKK